MANLFCAFCGTRAKHETVQFGPASLGNRGMPSKEMIIEFVVRLAG